MKRSASALASIAALAFTAVAHADWITNGSFENPAPDSTWNYGNPDGAFIYNTGQIPGWTTGYGATGIWAPNLGPNTFASLPDGTQAGWASDAGQGSMMFQGVAGLTLTGGMTLTLTGFEGSREDLRSAYGLAGGGWAALKATDGTLLAYEAITAAPGTFKAFSISVTLPDIAPYLGEGLYVELGNAERSQASFDKISLSTDVPGPAADIAFLTGIIGSRRRRR